ncbi:hypothetical protein HY041_00720 [Candidatus Roizmanbacteria bacterium]|nr:hypothetical protein [Candidatus Roizmanbacteria bacterium]
MDSFFKKKTAYFFYRFINFLSDTPIPDNVGDFRLLDREAVRFLNNLPERSRFLRGLVAWGNYPTDYIYFKREKRFTGETLFFFFLKERNKITSPIPEEKGVKVIFVSPTK